MLRSMPRRRLVVVIHALGVFMVSYTLIVNHYYSHEVSVGLDAFNAGNRDLHQQEQQSRKDRGLIPTNQSLLPGLGQKINSLTSRIDHEYPSTAYHGVTDTYNATRELVNLTTVTSTTAAAIANDSHRHGMQTRFGWSTTNQSMFENGVSFGGCCGIGHRLNLNLRTLVYAARQRKLAYAAWGDVAWGTLFNNTEFVVQAPFNPPGQKRGYKVCRLHYTNKYPHDWAGPNEPDAAPVRRRRDDVYGQFGPPGHQLMQHRLVQQILQELRDNLSAGVVRHLHVLRRQYRPLHLCAHFRLGNNETGDWALKGWRHLSNTDDILNVTLYAMIDWVNRQFLSNNTAASHHNYNTPVSVFVAGDTGSLRPWFQQHAPSHWRVVMGTGQNNGLGVGLPGQGVWFGQFDSGTNRILTAKQKTRAMVEAVAEMFALGECSALFIPTYSSFALVPISLSYSRAVPVEFRLGMRYVER